MGQPFRHGKPLLIRIRITARRLGFRPRRSAEEVFKTRAHMEATDEFAFGVFDAESAFRRTRGSAVVRRLRSHEIVLLDAVFFYSADGTPKNYRVGRKLHLYAHSGRRRASPGFRPAARTVAVARRGHYAWEPLRRDGNRLHLRRWDNRRRTVASEAWGISAQTRSRKGLRCSGSHVISSVDDQRETLRRA